MESELTGLRGNIKDKLKGIQSAKIYKDSWIGVGGTITTLASMHLKHRHYQPEVVDGHVLPMEYVRKAINQMQKVSLLKRRQMVPIDPSRADILLPGAIILDELAQQFAFEKIIVSDRGLRLGIVIRELYSNPKQV
jgi:exopolyphosphatase/guanosine-5'-triphosphate,3'-diphosphate pyrophosphatase